MELEYKRKLSELITLYELEPELNDIFVEGVTDKCIISRFISSYESSVKISEINEIDFSEVYHTNDDLKSNCKAKIVELSNQLYTVYSDSLSGIMCIVDKDFDEFFGQIIVNPYLFYTDYSSIELLYFNEETISVFFRDVLHGFPFDTKKVIQLLTPVLNSIFNVKLSLKTLFGLSIEVNNVDFSRHITIDKASGTITFDSKNYIFSFLNTNRLTNRKEEVEDLFVKISNESIEDSKIKIRGHDLCKLLYQYIHKIKNNIQLSYDTFERVIFLCIDLNVFNRNILFQTISKKYVCA